MDNVCYIKWFVIFFSLPFILLLLFVFLFFVLFLLLLLLLLLLLFPPSSQHLSSHFSLSPLQPLPHFPCLGPHTITLSLSHTLFISITLPSCPSPTSRIVHLFATLTQPTNFPSSLIDSNVLSFCPVTDKMQILKQEYYCLAVSHGLLVYSSLHIVT